MRVLLSCFMLITTFSLNASKEFAVTKESVIREIVADDADLRTILHKGILKEDIFQSMLPSIASYILANADIEGSPYRLVSAFKKEIKKPESEKQFLEIISMHFNAEESRELATFLQTESYKTYRPLLSNMSYEGFDIAQSILQQLTSSKKEHIEKQVGSRDSSAPHLRIILEQVLLNDKFFQKVLNELAQYAIHEQKAALTPQELIVKFQEAMNNRGFEDEFFKLIHFYFSDDEIEKVSGFVQNSIYHRYCDESSQLISECFVQSHVVFVELLHTSAGTIFINECSLKALCEDNFDAMMSSDKPVIVLIGCNDRNYDVEEFDKDYGEIYDIYHLNIDEQGLELATRFAGFGSLSIEITEDGFVRSYSNYTYPTFIFIDHGKEVGAHEGEISMDRLLKKANELFGRSLALN